MNERKEKLRPSKIVFFDADKTLWQVLSKDPTKDDWASKGESRTFALEAPGCVIRSEDNTKFILKDGVIDTLRILAREGVVAGMISDNVYEDVVKVSQLLGIWDYFDKVFVNIRLWKGPADKGLMVSEVLSSEENEKPKVLLVDDSEKYGAQMATLGYSFILSPKDIFPKDSILGFFGVQ